jgi:hypothetical protein
MKFIAAQYLAIAERLVEKASATLYNVNRRQKCEVWCD